MRGGDVEVELIEPLGDTAAMYKDFLPGGDELSIRFHHVAVRVEGAMDNWDKYAASIDTDRSEEHTSELQSLMRISYAVFCLKKNTSSTITLTTTYLIHLNNIIHH